LAGDAEAPPVDLTRYDRLFEVGAMSETTAAELGYLSRALKAPRIRAVSGRLASRTRDEGWDYEAYLAAVLAEEVSARDSHGGSARVKAARFPATKTLDDFDFTVQTSVSRQVIAYLAQLDFLAEAQHVVLLGPPGTGKTHPSIGLGVAAARRGHRVAFATALDVVGQPARRLSSPVRHPSMRITEVAPPASPAG
jgi:DNA replication protein DnaC